MMMIKKAKCFNGIKKFYNPAKPSEVEKYKKRNILIQSLHERFQHASKNELKLIIPWMKLDYGRMSRLKMWDIGSKKKVDFAQVVSKEK